MRQIHWKKTLLFGAALLLAALTVFHINRIGAPPPAEDKAIDDSACEDAAEDSRALAENEPEEIQKRSFEKEDSPGPFDFEAIGGAIIISWDPSRFQRGDSIEVIIYGKESQRGVVLPAKKPIFVFQDGKDGESYRFALQVRHSDGSPGEHGAKTVVFRQNMAASHDLLLIGIETDSGQDPNYHWVESPEGALGHSITENDYVKGRCRISNLDTVSSFCVDAKIRVRGNTSAGAASKEGKKPYKLVLNTPVDLFGTGRRESRFVLLASGTDLNSYLGFTIAQIVGMDWAQNCRFVNLVLNGDWKGLYLITESIDAEMRDEHIAPDGLLMEYDAYWWKEDFSFRTMLSSNQMAFTVKYPDIEADSEEAILLQEYVEKLEDSIIERSEYDFLDIDSFVKWLTVRDLLGHGDQCGSNMFYYLRHWNTDGRTEEKLFMGPLWDFDAAFTHMSEWSDQRAYPSWFYWLLQDARFRGQYVSNWKSLEPKLYAALSSRLKELCETYGQSVNLGRFLDDLRWRQRGFVPVEEEARRKLSWLNGRIDWMNGATEKMADEIYGSGDLVAAVSKDCTSLGVLLRDRDYTDVSFAVWSEVDGQNDLHWYHAEKGNDGSWGCMADLYNHRSAGLYIIRAYEVTDGNTSFLEEYRCFVRYAVFPEEYIALDPIDSSHIRISLVSDLPHEQIMFPVWSEADGQEDLNWYQGSLNQDGIWSFILDLDRHTREGFLNVHAYETGGGESILLDCVSVYLGPQ